MKTTKILFYLVLFLNVGNAQALSQKPWTLLFYVTGSDVSQALVTIYEMTKVGSHKNMQVIVHYTVHENNQQKVTKKLYVEKGMMVEIGAPVIRDSGDATTLDEALQWACNDYPSEHLAVVLWDRGSGVLNRSRMIAPYKGMYHDNETDYYLADRDYLDAFTRVCSARKGKKIDVIVFDTCYLASLECAYTLSSCADYLVASEGKMGDRALQYASLLQQSTYTVLDPLACAKCIVRSSVQKYNRDDEYVLSVIDLNELHSLVENCNVVAQILRSQLQGKYNDVVKSTIKKCIHVNNCTAFDDDLYIDMYQFYKNLLKHSDGLKISKLFTDRFNQLLMHGIQLFPTVVKEHKASARYAKTGGLSVYFSRYALDFSYYGLYWTEHNPNWLSFLETFLTK
jgi:hypothetical protein